MEDSPPNADAEQSVLREIIVEHAFIGELLRALWIKGVRDVEVLRSEFDAHGYDLILSRGKIVRHIQLKTQAAGPVVVSRMLGDKPSGCVVWIQLDRATLQPEQYRWFGNSPGEPLSGLDAFPVAKRTTRNKQGEQPVRRNHVAVPKSAFEVVPSLDEIIIKLLGVL